MTSYQTAAVVLAGVLVIDALIHLYWLTGRTWPARDTRTLSHAVLNAEVPFTPRVLVPLVVVLAVSASLVLTRAGLLWEWLPGWVALAGTIAVGVGLLLRGGAGLFWVAGIGARRDSAFYWLNLVAYTPACFLLGAAAFVVAAR